MRFTVVVAMFGTGDSETIETWTAPESCRTATEAGDWARDELWRGENPKGRVQSVR